MRRGETDWLTPDTRDLMAAIVSLDDPDEAGRFFRDLCTLGELHDMAQRWAVAQLLDAGLHYGEISRRTGASTATITRIASWLHHGEGGYAAMLERTRPTRSQAARAPEASRTPSATRAASADGR